MSLDTTLTATADPTLPDPTKAGFAEKLYRLDGGHSLANDESVWTPGENVGRSITAILGRSAILWRSNCKT
jgi:N-acyl homoserine lactone hydrolase